MSNIIEYKPKEDRDAADPDVLAKLQVDSKGKPKSSLANLRTILLHDRKWRGRISYDTLTRTVCIDTEPVTDDAVTEMRIDVSNRYEFEPAKAKAWEVVHMVARTHDFNPLVEYLDNLRWDGNLRLDRWLVHSLGVEDTPLHRVFSRRWCISAVARAFEPGCKVDTLLLLVGPQGAGKSTALKLLAGEEWFRDTAVDLRSKDGFMQLSGVWVYEIAEMTSFAGVRAERVKGYVSSSEDSYRPPYGRTVVRLPRQTVFAASTNDETPLEDPTGSRRFWPMTTPGPIDAVWLTQHRDQVWAEAVEAFHAEEAWHLTDDEDKEREVLARQFEATDPWAHHVEQWASQQVRPFTIRTCVAECLGIPEHRQGKAHQNRVGAILRKAGYAKRKAGRHEVPDGSRPQLWSRWNEEGK